MKPALRSLLRWLALGCAIAALDQASKWWVLEKLAPGVREAIIPGWFDLTLVFNRGAAFSFLADQSGWQRWFFTAVSFAAALIIPWLIFRQPGRPLGCAALTAIWSGAVGNGIDRAVHGQVTDFFLFFRESWNFYFPAFNIADTGISIGVVMLLLDEWLIWRRHARKGAPTAKPGELGALGEPGKLDEPDLLEGPGKPEKLGELRKPGELRKAGESGHTGDMRGHGR